MPRPPRPTAAELAILHVLWARGPSTVMQALSAQAPSAEELREIRRLIDEYGNPSSRTRQR